MKWAAVSFRTTKVPSLIATSNDWEPPSGSPQITVNTHCSPKAAAVPPPLPSHAPRIRLPCRRRHRKVSADPFCFAASLLCPPPAPGRSPPLSPAAQPASRPGLHKGPGRRGNVLSPWSRPGDKVPAPRPSPTLVQRGCQSRHLQRGHQSTAVTHQSGRASSPASGLFAVPGWWGRRRQQWGGRHPSLSSSTLGVGTQGSTSLSRLGTHVVECYQC